MQSMFRLAGCMLAMLLIVTGGSIAQAAPQTPASADPAPQGGQTDLYLPLVTKGYPLLNDAVGAIEPVAEGGLFHTPMDATPDPDATNIYFTAQSDQGAGVFRVPITGGTAVSITVGAPFSMPYGLAVSMNGQTIYVADPGVPMTSTVIASGGNQARQAVTTGALFRVPVTGGEPQIIAGTERTSPRGLEVTEENGVETLYFLGNHPDTGAPAVMKIPASGGTLAILLQGAPLVNPVHVSLLRNNVAWVITDDAASGNGLGSVFLLERNGQVTTLADHVRMGAPAGVALTFDESLALVSTLDAQTGTSQVLAIDLTTREQGIITKVINVNHASGGLHRARNRNVMAWCGVTAGTSGQGIVYRISF
jgi:hypothetical protein